MSYAKNVIRSGVLLSTLFLMTACGSSTSNSSSTYDTSTAEVAAQSVAGAAGASDNTGTVVTLNSSPQIEKNKKLMAFDLIDMLFESKASASACSSNAPVIGAACSGTGAKVMTLNMGSCSGLVGTWTGSYTLTFDSNSSCSTAASSGLMSMASGSSVVITTVNAGLNVGNYTVSMSSSSSGYSVAESGGISVTCNMGGCSTSRTVSILGVNRILMLGSATLYNHTVNTPTPFTITGVGAAKQISAGQIQLQHNLAHFMATTTISQTLGFSAGCCLPTSGSMTTAFSNGKSGAETITFGSCGSATVGTSPVSLNYCM